MKGEKGMLDFLQQSEEGFMQGGVCVCFIFKIRSDCKSLEDLGTARQLAFGLQLHVPSFLSF